METQKCLISMANSVFIFYVAIHAFLICYINPLENVKDMHTIINIFKLKKNKKWKSDLGCTLPLNFYLHLSHYKNI